MFNAMDRRRFVLFAIVMCAHALSSTFALRELKLLHVVFAHKLYAPIEDISTNNGTTFPRNLTYEYFHSSPMDMPKVAKLNMFDLGVHLRETYGGFLGDIYTTEVVKTRTTEYPLSIMSAQLVNAGLWPPARVQKWNADLDWQPIPSDYVAWEKDTLLLGTLCPNFLAETAKVSTTEEIRKELLYHQPLFRYISRHAKIDASLPSDISRLYSTLETIIAENLPLPSWAEGILDGEMYNVTLLEYDILSQTSIQRQLNGGVIVKRVIRNSLSYIKGSISDQRKIMLYSGDQRNIAGILKDLNTWSPHVPNHAASIIFQLLFDNETATYGIQTDYYTGVEGDTIPLVVPGCSRVCPIHVLSTLVSDSLPLAEETLCGSRASVPSAGEDGLADAADGSSTVTSFSRFPATGNIVFALISLFAIEFVTL